MTDRTDRPLTEVEHILIAHLVADHAASFYGQRGSMFFGKSDAVRYVTEGYVGKRLLDVDWNVLWEAVGAEVDAHPEVLNHPLTDIQIKARYETRRLAAEEYEVLAVDAFKAGDCPLAVSLADAAERECPDRPGFRGWDDLRTFVADKYEETVNA